MNVNVWRHAWVDPERSIDVDVRPTRDSAEQTVVQRDIAEEVLNLGNLAVPFTKVNSSASVCVNVSPSFSMLDV